MRNEAKIIFLDVVGLQADERIRLLSERCAGDSALRVEVESLIRAHDQAAGFLAGATVGPATLDSDASNITARQIGPYKLLQVIGEGGFGTVYMAEQEHPVRRRVALKVIKLGMDTRQVVARFEAERQALAMMDHPNIARVFDAGATESGRPYFVMELVRGEPITQYCDINRFTPRQRLELFIPVCQAVQHAHQKGIIHRDIKPSNVLVTMHDGKPVPKVIDFGIAKATQARLTEKTLFTEFRQMIGTPEYMSPEQAEMSGLDVDTRSDVYSLGVLLYELLTGTTPFDARELRSKAFAEMQRVIREVDPPKMSNRLSTLGETLPSVAAQRNIEPRKLGTLVRGDLDWIVMKCLEKDRTRRYESASGLAQDVQHYLSDEPVTAGSPSAGYRVRKFVARHRIGVGMAAGVVLALAVGLGIATWALIRAIRAERLAQDRLLRVEREAAKSAAVNRVLDDMLTSANPERTEMADASLRQLLEETARQMDAGALGDQPEIAASVRTIMGRSFQSLGRSTDAVAQLRRALEQQRTLRGDGDDPDVASIMNLLGMALADLNQLDEAERFLRDAQAMRTRLEGPGSVKAAESGGNLATVLSDRGNLEAAEVLLRETADVYRKRQVEPVDRLTNLYNLSAVLQRRGKLDEAERVLRESLELLDSSIHADSPQRGNVMSGLATLLLRQGRYADAVAPQQEALRIARKTFPANHPRIASALNGLGQIALSTNRAADAEKLFREALEIAKSARGINDPEVAGIMCHLGIAVRRQNRMDEAEPLLRQALDIHIATLGSDHIETAITRGRLATLQMDMGKTREAEQNMVISHDLLRQRLGPDHSETAMSATRLATLLVVQERYDDGRRIQKEAMSAWRKLPQDETGLFLALLTEWTLSVADGRLEEAEAISRELLSLAIKRFGEDSPETALARSRLANALVRRGAKLDEAESAIRSALAVRERILPPSDWALQGTRSILGEILLRTGRIDEAEPLLVESHQVMAASPLAPAMARRDARDRLIELYVRQGRHDQAEQLRRYPTTRPG
jgi:serine/threonine protein kinase/tetratricopeptide (TPR) repeat protein